jgi:hypothetical protein
VLCLAGHDVVGLARTGCGKTAVFALPILQQLMDAPRALSALVLSPTRKQALLITEALGSGIALKTSALVGGVDMMAQARSLGRRPHATVGTLPTPRCAALPAGGCSQAVVCGGIWPMQEPWLAAGRCARQCMC